MKSSWQRKRRLQRMQTHFLDGFERRTERQENVFSRLKAGENDDGTELSSIGRSCI
jgi:hypothetical protein